MSAVDQASLFEPPNQLGNVPLRYQESIGKLLLRPAVGRPYVGEHVKLRGVEPMMSKQALGTAVNLLKNPCHSQPRKDGSFGVLGFHSLRPQDHGYSLVLNFSIVKHDRLRSGDGADILWQMGPELCYYG